jgi:adenylate cyclase
MITREIDRITVCGKTEGLAVYELIDSMQEANGDDPRLEWIGQYEEGLLKYRKRDFPSAIRCFEVVLRDRPHDRPAALMLDRCRGLKESGADETWQPVLALQSK